MKCKDVEGVQQALDSLGSIQKLTLTQLARARKILFVEGANDFKTIRRFAKLVGLSELAAGTDLTPFESGGFSSWGLRNTLGADISIGAVYDLNYWCDGQIIETQEILEKELSFAHIHRRKEMENYLLVSSVLSRALEKVLVEREKRTGVVIKRDESIDEILDRITENTRTTVQGQYIGKYCEFFKSGGKNPATLSAEAIHRFDEKWFSLNLRLEIVPGKSILRNLRNYINQKWSVSLTDIRIIDEFKAAEIPSDLMDLLRTLNDYRAIENAA